jgi:hypothetical protein
MSCAGLLFTISGLINHLLVSKILIFLAIFTLLVGPYILKKIVLLYNLDFDEYEKTLTIFSIGFITVLMSLGLL